MRFLLSAAALLVASPASDQTLWRNVDAGMTRAQVEALYPASDSVKWYKDRVRIRGVVEVADCKPEVYVELPRGVVTEATVSMWPLGFKHSCHEAAYQSLLVKYGQPDTETNNATAFVSEPTSYTSKWLRNGVMITLERNTRADNWRLNYAPVAVARGL